MKLGFFKIDSNVQVPKMETEGAACFDLRYNPTNHQTIDVYTAQNTKIQRALGIDGQVIIMPRERVALPTGLILDIPEKHSVRVHPRSSISIKRGLTLANNEGVIDSDYIDELFVCLLNISENRVIIAVNDRIAQAELIPMFEYKISTLRKRPEQKTDRKGGLGSTGEK